MRTLENVGKEGWGEGGEAEWSGAELNPDED